MSSVISQAQRKQLHEQLDQLIETVPARLDELEQAERRIGQGVRRLGGALMQAWADAARPAQQVSQCTECGRPMRHRGLAPCLLETTLGRIRLRRPRRRCEACGREVYPHDRQWRFGSHGLTWTLAAVVARLGALLPFQTACRLLREDFGVELSKQTVEEVTRGAGEILLSEEDARREWFFGLSVDERLAALPRREKRPSLVALYTDGTMVHAEGEWREIRVGRAIAVDEEGRRLGQKTFARFLSVEEFGHQLFLEAHQVGYGSAERRAFLGDGAHWLWEIAAVHFPEAVPILDWYHLSQNVHQTAREVFGEGSSQAGSWAKAQLDHLWDGHHGTVRGDVARLRKRLRSKSKREALRKLGVYLKHNASRMAYPRYRELGLPIGSGAVESACKYLVGGRCKQSGMRNWGRRTAEAVLRLRAALYDEQFTALWTAHLRPAA